MVHESPPPDVFTALSAPPQRRTYREIHLIFIPEAVKKRGGRWYRLYIIYIYRRWYRLYYIYIYIYIVAGTGTAPESPAPGHLSCALAPCNTLQAPLGFRYYTQHNPLLCPLGLPHVTAMSEVSYRAQSFASSAGSAPYNTPIQDLKPSGDRSPQTILLLPVPSQLPAPES